MTTDCMILTALAKEAMSVLFQLRHFDKVGLPAARGQYYQALASNGIRVVVACPSAMGNLAIASLTHEAVSLFNPKTLILVGIAGGMDKEICLGDVVVSDQIVDYEIGKMGPDGFSPRWSVYRPDSRLLSRALSWPNQSWQKYIRTPRPVGSSEPKLHSGVFMSGNKVIADETTAGALRSVWRKAKAIEMEAAGVASVLYHLEQPPAFIVFKALCDYADASKNDDWQDYAADAAASCAISFVLDHLHAADVVSPVPKVDVSTKPKAYANRALREALSIAYSLGELKQLAFDIGIDWDDIEGRSKSEKIIDLVLHLKRRNRMRELISLVNEERDNILKAFAGEEMETAVVGAAALDQVRGTKINQNQIARRTINQSIADIGLFLHRDLTKSISGQDGCLEPNRDWGVIIEKAAEIRSTYYSLSDEETSKLEKLLGDLEHNLNAVVEKIREIVAKGDHKSPVSIGELNNAIAKAIDHFQHTARSYNQMQDYHPTLRSD